MFRSTFVYELQPYMFHLESCIRQMLLKTKEEWGNESQPVISCHCRGLFSRPLIPRVYLCGYCPNDFLPGHIIRERCRSLRTMRCCRSFIFQMTTHYREAGSTIERSLRIIVLLLEMNPLRSLKTVYHTFAVDPRPAWCLTKILVSFCGKHSCALADKAI